MYEDLRSLWDGLLALSLLATTVLNIDKTHLHNMPCVAVMAALTSCLPVVSI